MNSVAEQFFSAYSKAFSTKAVYTDKIPKEMMASTIDHEGWFEWMLVPGTLQTSDYTKIEEQFNVKFPNSFVDWHKSSFFLDGDCSLLRLPFSNPLQPLEEVKRNLDWYIPKKLIPQALYPFAAEGNDAGPLVFDGRIKAVNNEFPIRVYEQQFGGNPEGLSEIIFSNFSKLLECLTHYMIELKAKKSFEILPDFFGIDPYGAGRTGIDYWLSWAEMQRANFEEFNS